MARAAARPSIHSVFAALPILLVLASPALAQDTRVDGWRADLATLAERFEARHPDPYHTISREVLRESVDGLHARIPDLEDHEIVVELARLLTRVGDGHTGLFISYDLKYPRFPLEIWNLDDGLLIAAASAEHVDLIGGRIVSVGHVSAADALARVDSLVSRDNVYALRGRRTLFAVPQVLDALGLLDRAEGLTLAVETADGRRVDAVVRELPMGHDVEWRWIRNANDLAHWLRHRDARYWLEMLPSTGALYFQYNDASWQDDEESLLAFTDRLADEATANDVERVIVDLRWNDGGSNRWTNMVLHALVRIEHALGHPRTENRDPGPPLFVLIGPTTFSAATSFALDLEEHTNAVFIGEPTGGRPVGYGGQSFIDLPRTGTRVRSSFRYQISSYPGDDRAALYPHVAAPPTIRSYRMNRDPALHAALEWRPRQSIAQRIAEAATTDGFEGAWTAWTTWREDPANRWLDTEGDLNTAGYRLLREEKTDAAVALFRVNAEAHPESANVHDSLAEGLVALGDTAAARAAYERALALDPTGPLGANARRMIRELRGRP